MDRQKIKIGYQVGASFEDWSKDGEVGFEILFPYIYSSYDEAERNNYRISAYMEKQDDGEVVIVLYNDKIPVETIHWEEWWKYKCNRIKEVSKDSVFVDANTDYEPYAEKFEKIFDAYCGNKVRNRWSMQYLAYWIEPVIVMDNDGSYTFRKNSINPNITKEIYKKIEQLQKILVEEFPKVPKDRIELIANRIYDQVYEDKDV